jgi:hypothetical protein
VVALGPLLLGAGIGLWPHRHVRNAAELDNRLRLGDRLATAWAFRDSGSPILELQRTDALQHLQRHRPQTALVWRPRRLELATLGALALVALLLVITPSPQQATLDQEAAQALAVQQAIAQLDAVRQQADASSALTPEQAKQLDQLLQQAQAQLREAGTPQEATAILSQMQDQASQQLVDPNADLRDEALAAMSETLAAEPQTRALANAIQHEDAQAASQAVQDLAAHADQLSDVERQSLSRALQRAANVGRSDPRTSTALRDASQSLSPRALSQLDAALRDSIQASQSQAQVNATLDQLHELQNRLASGQPLPSASPQSAGSSVDASISGTPVAVSSGTASRTVTDPTTGQNGTGAGTGAASPGQAQSASDAQASENVFVPGRINPGSSDQPQQVDQPFSVRGAPRPYRDVLSQYAQSSRDYVDRPDISPAVRDLVKQYFQQLESDQ